MEKLTLPLHKTKDTKNKVVYGTKDGDVTQSVYIDKDALGDVWSVLRGLDGVDDKLLEHPAFEQLPAILGNDEVPEYVARNGDADIYVATDRRIIHFKTDFWKKSISKVTPSGQSRLNQGAP